MLVSRLPYVVASVFLIFLFIFFFFHTDANPAAAIPHLKDKYFGPPKSSTQETTTPNPTEPTHQETHQKATLVETLRDLFEPHPITKTYVDPAGNEFPIERNPPWTKPLGKRILLIDVDTRDPSGDNQIFNSKRIDYENLKMSGGQLVSNAVLNHYLFAQIHGYDYEFIKAKKMKGYYDTWIRPHLLYNKIQDYDFIVTMDADATVSHLEVPLEWMFNRWGVTSNTSISMPWDTAELTDGEEKCKSCDSKGKLVYNAGFIIAQNREGIMDLLEAWRDCAGETRYEGCGQWKEQWSHEQRAFSEYIRYDFNPDGNNIVPIPCNDAMGYPNFQKEHDGISPNSDCNGNFIRHHTLSKEKSKTSAMTAVMQILAHRLQQQLHENKNEVFVDEAKADGFWNKWNDS